MKKSQPLFQKRILVTRARGQTDTLCNLLRGFGAEPIELPLIEFRRIVTIEQAGPIIGALDKFSWIVFTSSNTIQFFFELLDGKALPEQVRLACVGGRTADKLSAVCRPPDLVPEQFSGRNLAEELDVGFGQKVLFPSAQVIGPDLQEVLEAKGAEVVRWPIYETLATKLEEKDHELLSGGFDIVTFASPSVVDSFCEQIDDFVSVLQPCIVACMGPMTSRRASERGIRVDVVPKEHSVFGLSDSLAEHSQAKSIKRSS